MDPSTDEILQILQLIRTGGYVGYSVMCLVLYELVITINQEIEVVWKRKFTITSLLLLSTRWLMIVNPIVGNFSGETMYADRCIL
ncbi:hypothetical protein PsYK624_125390 [Phanerochaete sordida]|uniref:DUF6533 domain-containing protein n=1 Tax=Phanerochaete sordida TaxID=48140 RepID=A0A9P3GMT6_9APHY|nr:hypothetical protein PsYK624_125390 [Phanerochaete sordida]